MPPVGGDPVNGVDPSGLFVDTLTDGIAIAGCLFALARDNIYGSCDNLGSNLGNCAIAAAAFVLPFVSYGMLGLGKRLGRRTSRAPDMPCGAGLCPCFVAGTLVATLAMSSVAGADFNEYVDSNAPIESLQVGQRVLTALSDGEDTHTEVTSDWQVIDLELGGAEGQVLLTVLRPPEWLPYMDPNGDGTFELELPELRLRGLAHVIHVRGPPAIVDAPGRVVLSTVEHRVESVLALTFADDEEDASEVVTTPNHPFYSVSRGWTAAGDLRLGESVQTRDGERTLVLAEYRDAPQSVFNLEVEGDHEYLVGESGLRVHNVCGRSAALRRAKRDLGIPRAQHPNSVSRVPLTRRDGTSIFAPDHKPIVTREYTYTRPDNSNVIIQDHSAGHYFGEGGVGDQGPHFNVRPPDNTRTGSVPGISDHFSFE